MKQRVKSVLQILNKERGETSGGAWCCLFIILIVFGMSIFSGSESDYNYDYDYNYSPSQSSYDPSEDLDILTYKQTSDGYFQYIEGAIKNNSDYNFIYAQVDISLYDRNGYVVETTFDNVNNIAPGEVWHFKAMIFDGSNASSFKIKDVSGF